MPFWSDALRVVAGVAAPVLAATGVGIPLAILIAVPIAACSTLGADAIDRDHNKNVLRENAQKLRQETDNSYHNSKNNNDKKFEQAQNNAKKEEAHAKLPGDFIHACKNGDISKAGKIIAALDNEQFEDLGLKPISVCKTASMRLQIQKLIAAEELRRFGPNPGPTHKKH